ncbi:MAG: hypothetical protein JSU00_19650 [Acidobacteria bacterium]|nr:hypothetical protein [Acidobacteriota bacterium]
MKLGLMLLAAGALWGQTNVLTVGAVPKLKVKRGAEAAVTVHAQLEPGYHVNSNKPNEEYLIPLKLSWKAEPLEPGAVTYPKAETEKAGFSDKPLSVFSGAFELVTKFKAPATAPGGMAIVTGKLRYQACNDRMCLPPKTIDVPVTVDIQ